MSEEKREIKMINEISKCYFDEVRRPDKLKRRIHDHNTHRDEEVAISDLEKQALSFLMDDCNMMEGPKVDAELLSLYNSIHNFMETGEKADAFNVYFCYASMVFSYEKARKLVEMISNFETNASKLLMSHRDHYSHSVYVFILGLAIYKNNKNVRNALNGQFAEEIDDEKVSARKFLEYWGLTALFHDIGYPFEIPFEEIESYFGAGKNDRYKYPYISFNNMSYFTDIQKVVSRIIPGTDTESTVKRAELIKKMQSQVKKERGKVRTVDVIAHNINRRLSQRTYPDAVKYGLSNERYIANILKGKPKRPGDYNYYMDHGLFSAQIIFSEIIGLFDNVDVLTSNYEQWMDCITAIIMHNSLFKFSLRRGVDGKKKPLELKEHPVAYLLMLCDELQAWDRTSYGRNSVKEIHAIDCEFTFDENKLVADYVFDKNQSEGALHFDKDGSLVKVKGGTIKKFYTKDEKGPDGNDKVINPGDLSKDGIPDSWRVAPDDCGECVFYTDIADIVKLGEESVNMKVGARFEENCKYRSVYLSELSMINIYDFAENIYKYEHKGSGVFSKLSLTRKLDYINMAKSFGRYLDSIGCFYSDKPKAFAQKTIKDFSRSDIREIVHMETDRRKIAKANDCDIDSSSVPLELYARAVDSEDPQAGFAAIYGSCVASYKSNDQSEKESEAVIKKSVKAAIKALYALPDVRVYMLPNSTSLTPIFENESEKKKQNPCRIVKRDLYGNILKVYRKKDWYEKKTDDGHKLILLKDGYIKASKADPEDYFGNDVIWNDIEIEQGKDIFTIDKLDADNKYTKSSYVYFYPTKVEADEDAYEENEEVEKLVDGSVYDLMKKMIDREKAIIADEQDEEKQIELKNALNDYIESKVDIIDYLPALKEETYFMGKDNSELYIDLQGRNFVDLYDELDDDLDI